MTIATTPVPFAHRLAGCTLTLLKSDNTSDSDRRHQNNNGPFDPRQDADELPSDIVAFSYMSTQPFELLGYHAINRPNDHGWYVSPRFFIGVRVTILGSEAATKQKMRRRDAGQLALLLEDPMCSKVVLFGRGQYSNFCEGVDEVVMPQFVEPD